MIATIWEVINDRHGDLNKRFDVAIRIILFVIEAVILRLILFKPLIVCFLLSTAIFFMLFDYLVAWVLIKNGIVEPRIGGGYTWWSYTAKKGWFDNLKLWKFASPIVRFGIKLAYLVVAVILFFKY